MNWKEQVEASDINKLATEYIKEFWSEQPKNIREKLDLSFRSGYLSAIEDAAKERAEIQAAALPVETEEEIKKLAEQEYPTEDARKNMFHDNYGQYERQEAFIKGFKAALPVKEEQEKPKDVHFDFVVWYSGMKEEKVLAAYRRWLKEGIKDGIDKMDNYLSKNE